MRNRARLVSAVVFVSAGVFAAIACSGKSEVDPILPGGDDSGFGSSDASNASDAPRVDAAPPGDSASPPFTPLALGTRLVLWLDAARAITLADAGRDAATIGAWGDQSGNNNNASASGASEPIANGGSSDAGVNGLPVVSFNGAAHLSVPESASLVWGREDFTIFTVFRYTNAVAQTALVIGKYDMNAPFPGPNLYANYFTPVASVIAGRADGMHFVVSADAGYNDGKIHVAGMRRSGARLEVRVDGTSSVNGDAGLPDGAPVDVSAPDAAVLIGSRPLNQDPLSGDIAEIVCLRGAVSDAELAQLEAYFRAKYGL